MSNLADLLAVAVILMTGVEYLVYKRWRHLVWQEMIFWGVAVGHLVMALRFIQVTSASHDHLLSSLVTVASVVALYIMASRMRQR